MIARPPPLELTRGPQPAPDLAEALSLLRALVDAARAGYARPSAPGGPA